MKPDDFGLAPEVAHEIGGGATITLLVHDGEVVGLNEAHVDKNGKPCLGFVAFEGAHFAGTRPTWKVESKNPLTLSPSILCRTCGNHGFIRNGKWVAA